MNKIDTLEIVDRPKISELRRIRRVMFSRRLVIFGTIIILLLIIVAIFSPQLAPYDPFDTNLKSILQRPSLDHLLGTDELGRDLLSRVIWGSRISLLVGIVAVTIAGILGINLGLIAGYFGGFIQNVIMGLVDALLALPPLLLTLAITTVLGGGLFNVLMAIGIAMFPTYCRLMCGQILSSKESDYVIASKSIGCSHQRIMFRHLLPNSFPPLLVLITLNMGQAILMEASLSFLGIGIRPPTPTWGSIVNEGYQYLLSNNLLSIVPGICIVLVVVAFNLVGDGLRDALDPKLRGTL